MALPAMPARAQSLPAEAKIGLGGAAADAAALVLGNGGNQTVVTTSDTAIPALINELAKTNPTDGNARVTAALTRLGLLGAGTSNGSTSGPLPAGPAAGIGPAANFAGVEFSSGSASFVATLVSGPISTIIVISTSTTGTFSATSGTH